MSDPNLVTTCNLHGQEFLVKMNVVQNYLELAITDKQSGEEWQCSYDNSFIENLTHKTGNFKQFDIFVTMLKTGLLKTSSCVSLDLLTYDDLEMLRIRKLKTNPAKTLNSSRSNNRRYLILTYTVEFDRIHYPLPLEYCGPPDPTILQATIRKLETELQDAKEIASSNVTKSEAKEIYLLQKRIEELEYENDELRGEIYQLKKHTGGKSKNQMHEMQRAINNLEKSVVSERKSHHRLVEQLRNEKIHLHKELDKMKNNEKLLKIRVQELVDKQLNSADTFRTMYRRKRSPIIRKNEEVRKPRMRSISPRITKSEGWASDEKSFYEKSTKGTRTKSPDSSLSSARPTDYRHDIHSNTERPQLTKSTSPRKTKIIVRSRSTSAGSNGSSTSRKTKRSDNLREMVKSSEADFKSLEERMQWLQKLLKAQ